MDRWMPSDEPIPKVAWDGYRVGKLGNEPSLRSMITPYDETFANIFGLDLTDSRKITLSEEARLLGPFEEIDADAITPFEFVKSITEWMDKRSDGVRTPADTHLKPEGGIDPQHDLPSRKFTNLDIKEIDGEYWIVMKQLEPPPEVSRATPTGLLSSLGGRVGAARAPGRGPIGRFIERMKMKPVKVFQVSWGKKPTFKTVEIQKQMADMAATNGANLHPDLLQDLRILASDELWTLR
jgi:hypothetical protein